MENIVVVSCNYNGNIFVKNNILSVFNQTLKPKTHYFIDDLSTDGCYNIAEKTINDNSIDYIDLIKNKEKKYKIKNLYDLIHDKVNDEDIIVIVDGDDWLLNEFVLEKIYNSYDKFKCDYLYSNFVYSHNGHLGICKEIPDKDWEPYESQWITSHISTFKAKKFKEISYKNFLDKSGKWFEMGCDQAYVLPILENIRNKGNLLKDVVFLNEPLYVYHHTGNPSKPRGGSLGIKAHNAVTTIRQRGICNE